ncbi:MAG: sigma-70 family RNA polymerase sigma factor [Planctomycetaceae bacterium]
MLTDADFERLMERTRNGDEDAAHELVRLYEPEIRRAARMRLTDSRLRRIVDSMDICQSVFGRFFKKAMDGSYDPRSSEDLVKLLVRITRNRVIDLHRRQTTQKRGDAERDEQTDPADLAFDSPGPRTAASAKEQISRIRESLRPDELDIADRRTNGDSWEQISADLGQPAEVLRKRLSRALSRVRVELDEQTSAEHDRLPD